MAFLPVWVLPVLPSKCVAQYSYIKFKGLDRFTKNLCALNVDMTNFGRAFKWDLECIGRTPTCVMLVMCFPLLKKFHRHIIPAVHITRPISCERAERADAMLCRVFLYTPLIASSALFFRVACVYATRSGILKKAIQVHLTSSPR